jgi:K+-sensing histidine kinase KdpD
MKILESLDASSEDIKVSIKRSNPADLLVQKMILLEQPLVIDFINSVPVFVCVINKNREIIYSNKSFQDFFLGELEDFIGLRPGEAVECEHSNNSTGGCGTSEFCKYCGAAHAIIESHGGAKGVKECSITRSNNDTLELLVWATPIKISDNNFTIFALSDISHEKRRKALERIFFHDILNTAGGIRGFVEMIQTADEDEVKEFADITYNLTDKLIEEIKAQRTISAAENEELELDIQPFSTKEILEEVKLLYENHDVAKGKRISIRNGTYDAIIKTDKTVLRRILGNLLKNALEASKPGDEVSLFCKSVQKLIEFEVENPAFIPHDIQMQLFKRSFSTKGNNRGLGTYSIKLLTERYLKGQIHFSSDERNGTVFTATYPEIIG